MNKAIKQPKISFTVKYGWKGILSIFKFNPKGFLDPFSWIIIIWIITINNNTKGRIKCKEKNRVRVLLSTENPPQIQYVNIEPM